LRLKTPWYHGWNIVGVCIMMQMAALGVMANCFSFFLEPWSRDFNVPVSTLVVAVTLFSVPASSLAPLTGWAVERWSVSRVMLTGLVGLAACGVLVGFATHGWHILAIYGLLLPLAVNATAGIPSQTLVSRWFVKRRGLAFSISALGLVLAGVLYPPVVVRLIEGVGWRYTWWIFAALHLLVVGAAALLVLRNRPEPSEAGTYLQGEDHHALASTGSTISARAVLTRRKFWLVMLAFVPAILANSAVSSNFAPYVSNRGVDLATAANLLVLFNIAATIGKLGGGMLSDRYGNRLPLLLVTGAATLGMFELAWAQGTPALALGIVLLGFGQGMWVLLASCVAAEFGSRDFPKAYGFASGGSVFATFASPLVAYAAETTGSYTGALVLLGIACLAGMAGAFAYRDSAPPAIGPEDEAELALINRA
jgi:MFS family permease